ncbi:hypothetical protein J2T13_000208 [Paenibacillus sp. DS2015]
MLTQVYVKDFTACPPRMFLELAEMSADNPKLARIWRNNYIRVITERVLH